MASRLRSRDGAFVSLFLVLLLGAPMIVSAATTYVWMSGFGSQSSAPAKTMSLVSAGALVDGEKTYTVASATPGLRYEELTFTVDGNPFPQSVGTSCAHVPSAVVFCTGSSAGRSPRAPGDLVAAGDSVLLGGISSGQTLRIIDAAANSVILTLTVG